MAAAARNGDSDRERKIFQDKLAILWARCKSPAALEKNIVDVRADADDLATAVHRYQRPAPPPTRQATEFMVQDLQGRLEAFYEYAMLRADHRDHEHLMGRVQPWPRGLLARAYSGPDRFLSAPSDPHVHLSGPVLGVEI